MKEIYVKCEDCFAHYPKGFLHKCDDLMKMLVKNYKKKGKRIVN